jgi:hypothetical protein
MAINAHLLTSIAAVSSLTTPMPRILALALLSASALGFGFVAGYFFRPSLDDRRHRLQLTKLHGLIRQKDRRIIYLQTLLSRNAKRQNQRCD